MAYFVTSFLLVGLWVFLLFLFLSFICGLIFQGWLVQSDELKKVSSEICKNAYVMSSGAFWSSRITNLKDCSTCVRVYGKLTRLSSINIKFSICTVNSTEVLRVFVRFFLCYSQGGHPTAVPE